ncbi:MAG: hypothetical protein ACI4QD_08745 [Kiritimatiellia bacterium]
MKSSIALLAALTPLLLAHSATVRFIQTKDEALEYACPGNWFLSSTNRPLPMLGRVPTASDSGRGRAILNLGGGDYRIGGWSEANVTLSNGTLRLSQYGGAGRYVVGDKGELQIRIGGIFGFACPREGANDWIVKKGGRLQATGKGVRLENLRVTVEPGGEYIDSFGERLAMHCNRGEASYKIINSGSVTFEKGLHYTSQQWGAGVPVLVLKPGAVVNVGGDIVQNQAAHIKWRLQGGKVHLTARSRFDVTQLAVSSNATVEIEVDKGVLADLSALTAPDNATVIKTGPGTLILGEKPAGLVVKAGKMEYKTPEQRAELDWRFADLRWHADTVNRCYYLDLEYYSKHIDSIAYTYPNKEVEGGLETVTTKNRYFRRRFPEGQTKPFEVTAVVTDKNGRHHTLKTTIVPRTGDRLVKEPWKPEEMLVGFCTYTGGTESMNRVVLDIATNELCNLICIWGHAGNLVKGPGKVGKVRPEVIDLCHEKKLHLMTIYPSTSGEAAASAIKEWGDRYHYANIGEYCSYLYQGAQNCRHIPADKDMLWQRERLVTGAIFRHLRANAGKDYLFSTSGSPLAHYELQGGIEFICNELYAVGSANLGYASSEARGAARRWKPEYWCSWHAQDWQTWSVPYYAPEKYMMLLAGYYQQYVMGTSLVVLESGSESTQAWKYTQLIPSMTNRANSTYHDYPSTQYRLTTKKLYDFSRQHPRDKGSPDTNIGLVLGHLGAYVGMLHAGFAMWGNHACAATNSVWKNGRPEQTWATIQDLFFPRGKEAIKPYQNLNLSGSPYGQVDIVAVDDEARYSDIARYKLLAYVGWNTMTPEAMRCLEKYVRKGGELVICTPHLSTRVDRDHLNYTVKDLLQLRFAGIEVTGRKRPPKGKWDYAEVKLADNCEVVEEREGMPLIVKAKVGKGHVWFYTPWLYPAWDGKPYQNLLRRLADEVQQRVVIRNLDEKQNDRIYVCYAAYGQHAYFLNMDCKQVRTVKAIFADGSEQILKLEPCTIKIVDMPKSLRR